MLQIGSLEKKNGIYNKMPQKEGRLDPKQIEFLKNYLNPKSKTFGNAKQSALKVGYSNKYAENLMNVMPQWLGDNMENLTMVKKAEKNLDEFLDLDITNKGITKDGKEIYEYDDVGKLRVKADISKFVAERLNKKKWSERRELTDAEGKPLLIK